MPNRREWGLGTRFHQSLSYAVAEKVMDEGLMSEAYLGLRRVHVNVDFAQWHLDKQEYDGENACRQDVSIGFVKSVQDDPVPHHASVYKKVQRIAVQLVNFRF